MAVPLEYAASIDAKTVRSKRKGKKALTLREGQVKVVRLAARKRRPLFNKQIK